MIKKILNNNKYIKRIAAVSSICALFTFKKVIAGLVVNFAMSIMQTSTLACPAMGFHELEYPED